VLYFTRCGFFGLRFYDSSNVTLWLLCSEVYIRASSKGRPFTIREVKASNIGQLVRIAGIVTRCSDVKPLMQVAVYTCEDCGFEIYQVIYKSTPRTALIRCTKGLKGK
jgi:DNA replicative helicase MCM subunit Mcm2 (Cdc46/Mcm family)